MWKCVFNALWGEGIDFNDLHMTYGSVIVALKATALTKTAPTKIGLKSIALEATNITVLYTLNLPNDK